MDSSVLELKDALALITDYNQAWDFSSNGADAAGFAKASQLCRKLSSAFDGANTSLKDGWYTAADLFYKLQQKILDDFGDMYDAINLFTDESYQAELAAKAAVESANDAASSILTDLGLDPELIGVIYPVDHTGQSLETPNVSKGAYGTGATTPSSGSNHSNYGTGSYHPESK